MVAGPDEYIGRTLDKRYRVRRLIGRGGMGAVYEADHIGLDKRVAIKFLLERGDPDMVARFRREARAASKVEHEHVVQIFDVGTDDSGVDFIAMEYVEGDDLKHVLDRGALPVERALHIGKQILRGLQAIHDGGILHRDIKPANIVLTTRDGDPDFVAIMDFGISKSASLSAAAKITLSGQVIGTPQYMAPELLAGAAGDHRSDLYSAALTIYEMIAGAPPFQSAQTTQVVGMHLAERPPALDAIVPDVPLHVVRAIERALDKSPSQRFANADEFVAALGGDDHAAPRGRLAATRPVGAPVAAPDSAPPTRPLGRSVPPPDGNVAATRPLGAPGPATAVPSANYRDSARAAAGRDAPPSPPPRPRSPRWPFAIAAVLIVGAPLGVYLAMRKPERVAAVPVQDASVAVAADAAVVPPPDAALAIAETPIDAGVDARAGSATTVRRKPRQPAPETGKYCKCMVKDSVVRLCKKTTTPLCRCQVGHTPACETKPKYTVCEAAYTLPLETKGRPCSGYISAATDWVSQGGISCSWCPHGHGEAFRGQPGEPCSAFHPNDGKPVTGILGFCQDGP